MRVGIVIIGRNEGERLRLCLESAMSEGVPTVYVDSGSTDASVELAKQLGCAVHELATDRPFNAARARNEGLDILQATWPDLDLVQFLDGDSCLEEGWLSDAHGYLMGDAGLCSVFGSIQERHPERSIFNRFTAVEWHAPPGEVAAFGGISLCRIPRLLLVGGFDESLVAGEEPELCGRLRLNGWRILSVDRPMAVHDAGMTRFSQWFRRCVRTGYVYAQARRKAPKAHDAYGSRPSVRIWFWSFGLPAVILLLIFIHPLSAVILAGLYPVQTIRVALGIRKRGLKWSHALLYGSLWHVSQFAQWRGQCRYFVHRLKKKDPLARDQATNAMTSIFDKTANADLDQEQEV